MVTVANNNLRIGAGIVCLSVKTMDNKIENYRRQQASRSKQISEYDFAYCFIISTD